MGGVAPTGPTLHLRATSTVNIPLQRLPWPTSSASLQLSRAGPDLQVVQPLGRERRSREGVGGAARRQLLHPAGGAAAAREVQSRTNLSSSYKDIVCKNLQPCVPLNSARKEKLQ